MSDAPMNLNEVATEDLVAMLRHVSVETGSLTCLGCGHEHNCSTRGCALIREAADRLDALRGPAIIPQAEMAREELRQWFAEWLEDYYEELHTEDDLTPEVAEAALVALRAPTREMVEKMRGEWKHYLPPLGAGNVQCRCTNCGRTPDVDTPFCAWCGSPMTDEAVDILWRRWKEALHEET